jgi:hypothetical protein
MTDSDFLTEAESIQADEPLPGSLFKVVVTLGMGGVVVAVVIWGVLRG